MNRSQVVLFVAAASLLGISGFSIAAQTSQPDRKGSDRTTQETKDDRGPLAGPTVKDTEMVQIAPFGGRSRDRGVQVPPFRWFQLLRGLDVQPEQRERIVAIHSEYQKEITAFRKEHSRELRQIEQQRREARENGQDLPREAILRYRQITAETPQPTEAQQEIWEVLNDDQQDQFRKILEAERTRMQERRRRDGATSDAVQKDAGDRMTPEKPAIKDNDTAAEPTSQPDTSDPAIEAARRAESRARADRRSRFLRAHQRSRQPGGLPADEDKKFKFTDGEG